MDDENLLCEENDKDDEIIIKLNARIKEVNQNLQSCEDVIAMVRQNQQVIKEAKRNYQTSLCAYKRAKRTI